jgi:CRISPR-associated endonuclease/helicase Cas3
MNILFESPTVKPTFAAHTPSNDRPGQWHDLKAHLTKVAKRARGFATKFNAGDLAYYAGLWHDLGKYNPRFQEYLQKCHTAKLAGQQPPTGKVPHAIYGAILANDLKITPLSFLIAGHHAGLPNQADLKSRLLERGDYDVIKAKAETEFSSLTVIEDLRAYFSPFSKNKIAADLFLRIVFSCLIDADRLDTEKFANPDQYKLREERAQAFTIAQLWEAFKQKQQQFVTTPAVLQSPVNQVRAEVYQKCLEAAVWKPGVFRLCVPTGGGKTRSGLAFALKHAKHYQKDRIIFAVPYTSIIDQTVKVYRGQIFQELGDIAVLEHHSAAQAEKNASESEQSDSDENVLESQIQAKLATQNWDVKLIVTTTVQLFESLLSHKTSQCRKLHNIVNSIIVLDEVQTLPIGLLSPIVSVLRELVDRYGVTLVLCTATQPALEGQTPYFKDGFPEDSVQDIISIEDTVRHFTSLKRVHYQIPKPGETWTWQQLVQDMQQNMAALVVLNTRRDALAVLNALTVSTDYTTEPIASRVFQVLKISPTLHLSTLLCGKHRQLVLDEVRRRLKNG